MDERKVGHEHDTELCRPGSDSVLDPREGPDSRFAASFPRTRQPRPPFARCAGIT
jgi:hypothetical protein